MRRGAHRAPPEPLNNANTGTPQHLNVSSDDMHVAPMLSVWTTPTHFHRKCHAEAPAATYNAGEETRGVSGVNVPLPHSSFFAGCCDCLGAMQGVQEQRVSNCTKNMPLYTTHERGANQQHGKHERWVVQTAQHNTHGTEHRMPQRTRLRNCTNRRTTRWGRAGAWFARFDGLRPPCSHRERSE